MKNGKSLFYFLLSMYTAYMKMGLTLLLIGFMCIIITLVTCFVKKCKSDYLRKLRRKRLRTLSSSGNTDCYLTDGKILCDETIQTEVLNGKFWNLRENNHNHTGRIQIKVLNTLPMTLSSFHLEFQVFCGIN